MHALQCLYNMWVYSDTNCVCIKTAGGECAHQCRFMCTHQSCHGYTFPSPDNAIKAVLLHVTFYLLSRETDKLTSIFVTIKEPSDSRKSGHVYEAWCWAAVQLNWEGGYAPKALAWHRHWVRLTHCSPKWHWHWSPGARLHMHWLFVKLSLPCYN